MQAPKTPRAPRGPDAREPDLWDRRSVATAPPGEAAQSGEAGAEEKEISRRLAYGGRGHCEIQLVVALEHTIGSRAVGLETVATLHTIGAGPPRQGVALKSLGGGKR